MTSFFQLCCILFYTDSKLKTLLLKNFSEKATEKYFFPRSFSSDLGSQHYLEITNVCKTRITRTLLNIWLERFSVEREMLAPLPLEILMLS